MWYIKLARWIMRTTLKKDPDLRQAYISNVAMLLYDRWKVKGHEDKNKAAEEILNLIFGR
jgi:hypothetical protein